MQPPVLARGPGRSSRRGFTLLEVAVLPALSAVVFVVVIRWVLGFADAATSTSEANRVASDAAYVTQALDADLSRATVCEPGGVPFVTATATQVAFYADVEGSGGTGGPDGIVDLVEWRFAGGAVERATVAGTGDCAALAAAAGSVTWQTVADGLSPDSTSVLSYFAPGSATAASPPGDCTTNPSSCLFGRVGVDAELVAPDGAPAAVSASVTVPLAGSVLDPAG